MRHINEITNKLLADFNEQKVKAFEEINALPDSEVKTKIKSILNGVTDGTVEPRKAIEELKKIVVNGG